MTAAQGFGLGPRPRTRVKICGVRSVADARFCAEAGADAVGVNFVPSSPRCVDVDTARAVATDLGKAILVVGVVAGMSVEAMRALRDATGIGCLQLHGDSPAADVEALLPHAYAAVSVSTAEDVRRAASLPGDYLLVDTKVAGALGGTGRVFDWDLVVDLATRRRLVLAGGLVAANVGKAIEKVRPWCVDTASGVESAPGVKDHGKIREFIAAVRAAG
ncbi:MAG: phosphoribosylanthranilate isomerase [Polyangiaceae bacterium]